MRNRPPPNKEPRNEYRYNTRRITHNLLRTNFEFVVFSTPGRVCTPSKLCMRLPNDLDEIFSMPAVLDVVAPPPLSRKSPDGSEVRLPGCVLSFVFHNTSRCYTYTPPYLLHASPAGHVLTLVGASPGGGTQRAVHLHCSLGLI